MLHYDADNILSPVINGMSINIVIALKLMAGWITNILDVKGAFLYGEFNKVEKKIYMEVPELFEGIYGRNVVLMLIKKVYELKTAAKEFWREMLRAFYVMV